MSSNQGSDNEEQEKIDALLQTIIWENIRLVSWAWFAGMVLWQKEVEISREEARNRYLADVSDGVLQVLRRGNYRRLECPPGWTLPSYDRGRERPISELFASALRSWPRELACTRLGNLLGAWMLSVPRKMIRMEAEGVKDRIDTSEAAPDGNFTLVLRQFFDWTIEDYN